MNIKVNGKDLNFQDSITVIELLKHQKVKMPDYVTVQLNDKIIPKEEFGTIVVKDNDIVEFLYFMGGGIS